MKTRIVSLAAALLAAAVFGASPAARDEAAWQQAMAKLQAARAPAKRAKDPKGFVDAILELGSATYAKRDINTANELVAILIQELADDTPTGTKEAKIDGLV